MFYKTLTTPASFRKHIYIQTLRYFVLKNFLRINQFVIFCGFKSELIFNFEANVSSFVMAKLWIISEAAENTFDKSFILKI